MVPDDVRNFSSAIMAVNCGLFFVNPNFPQYSLSSSSGISEG
jgi:hypothetical protein